MAERPLCFVIMPFGLKKDSSSVPAIDFDYIYTQAILPGIEEAGLEPVRADEERVGGIINKPMFERLLLCEYALIDLTAGNPNVFYKLGVRHAVCPSTTLSIFADNRQIPFDVNRLRALPYCLDEDNRLNEKNAAQLRNKITSSFKTIQDKAGDEPVIDSPLFQLMQGYQAPDIARLKTDVFREQVSYTREIKRKLASARDSHDPERIHQIEAALGPAGTVEAGIYVDLFLSYRAVEDWQGMIDLYDHLPAELKRTVLIREQLGFAYNRVGRRQGALHILEQIVDEQGPSSETCSLIGRIYKDNWNEACRRGHGAEANGLLVRAIEAYKQGFESDWRDAYPGINAVTLLDIKGDETSLALKQEMLPVVRFAVNQRIRHSRPDYWDYATLLELSVLAHDEKTSLHHLSSALAAIRESWEPKTTRNNLIMIHEARQHRGMKEPWLEKIIQQLRVNNMSN